MQWKALMLSGVGVVLGACGQGVTPQEVALHGPPQVERVEPVVEALTRWEKKGAGLPEGSLVKAFAHLDGVVYALVEHGGTAGLFSRRPGGSWVVDGPLRPIDSERPRALLRVDRALFLATADLEHSRGGLYRLGLEGRWEPLASAPSLPMTALARRGEELWVAASGLSEQAGLYASRDLGASFAKKGPLPRFGVPVHGLAVSTARVLVAHEPSRGDEGLFASDDEASSFVRTEVRADASALAASDSLVLVGTDVGAFRSRNFGHSFAALPFSQRALGFHVGGPQVLAGLDGAVAFSEDGGDTWFDLSQGLGPAPAASVVYPAGSQLWVFASGEVWAGPLRPSQPPPPLVLVGPRT